VFGAVEALVNVPKSRVVGAEASLRVDPIPSLTHNTGVTFLDTKVTSSFDNYNPFGAPANFQGEAFPSRRNGRCRALNITTR
jgi:iron complex outermembrane receptor protein